MVVDEELGGMPIEEMADGAFWAAVHTPGGLGCQGVGS